MDNLTCLICGATLSSMVGTRISNNRKYCSVRCKNVAFRQKTQRNVVTAPAKPSFALDASIEELRLGLISEFTDTGQPPLDLPFDIVVTQNPNNTFTIKLKTTT